MISMKEIVSVKNMCMTYNQKDEICLIVLEINGMVLGEEQ